ncbi:MAG: IS5/IS1182 family transposase, partial [Egibacteraceae bacterium]
KGLPAPIQAGKRWPVERVHAWMNHFKKLSRCTERRTSCVEFFLALVMAIIVVRCLIREAKIRYRW